MTQRHAWPISRDGYANEPRRIPRNEAPVKGHPDRRCQEVEITIEVKTDSVMRSRAQTIAIILSKYKKKQSARFAAKTPLTGYHGSNVGDITEFKSSYGAVEAWFTDDKKLASGYANEKTKALGGNATVYHATLQLKKPLKIKGDMNDKVTYVQMRKQTGLTFSGETKYGSETVDGIEQLFKRYEIITSPEFVAAAKKAGFDGVEVKEQGHSTWGVFDAKQASNITKRKSK
jgi:hypothetical protein